jgi:serine/threonine protein kinase
MNINSGDLIYAQTEKECFRVIQPIGNGSFGIVYEVQEVNTGSRYALKTIIADMLDSDGLKALINEGNLASIIEHENVLRVYYFHDGHKYPHLPPYMLMEFADGGTLENLINDRRAKQVFFSNDELRSLFLSLASGMRAINDRLVHRDIKPDNILFANGVLKVSDFGLSKVSGIPTRTETFKGINHIKYCAPEAWRLDKNTPAMDMYSMGIVFYEIATLNYPYSVDTTGDIVEAWKNAHFIQIPQAPSKLNSSLDIGLTQLIMKMTAKRPEDRYPTWNEIIQKLEIQEVESKKPSEITHLVQRAMDKHYAAEQERLKQDSERRQELEHNKIVRFCFQEIIQAAQRLVNEFNADSEFIKLEILEIREIPPFTIDIRQSKGNVGRIVITVIPIYGDYKLDNQRIKAWGSAKAPSGRGFNLLLVEKNSDDIYGQWITFHVSHSAGIHQQDNRPVPFPFEIDELPNELQYLQAMHIYQTSRSMFKSEFLHPLIEELF